jgi:hypothetical protein
MKYDYGVRFLEIEKKSQLGVYVDDRGQMRMRRDPAFDDEKYRLQCLMSLENKRELAKRYGVEMKDLRKERSKRRAVAGLKETPWL